MRWIRGFTRRPDAEVSGARPIRPRGVLTAEFLKDFGRLADLALSEPVTITKHGRDRLVMVSAAEYERLRRRARQVLLSAELSDEVIAQIAKAEVPAEHAHLDAELPDDWTP